MQTAAQAYGAVARQVASPRELEADLLLKAAARLQAVDDGWDDKACDDKACDDKRAELESALLHNRKLWSIFLTSVLEPDHPMPPDIRQNIANLGLFVMKQTVAILGEPERASLATLININRELAAGLRGK
jgi:flagellar biosynthesis activator protein FlaF